jgi:hypothetical protein
MGVNKVEVAPAGVGIGAALTRGDPKEMDALILV